MTEQCTNMAASAAIESDEQMQAAFRNGRGRVDGERETIRQKQRKGCGNCGKADPSTRMVDLPWSYRVHRVVAKAGRLYVTAGAWAAFRLVSGVAALWLFRGAFWIWQAMVTIPSGRADDETIRPNIDTCRGCDQLVMIGKPGGKQTGFCGACPCPKWRGAALFTVHPDSDEPAAGFKLSRRKHNCPLGKLPDSVRIVTDLRVGDVTHDSGNLDRNQ